MLYRKTDPEAAAKASPNKTLPTTASLATLVRPTTASIEHSSMGRKGGGGRGRGIIIACMTVALRTRARGETGNGVRWKLELFFFVSREIWRFVFSEIGACFLRRLVFCGQELSFFP